MKLLLKVGFSVQLPSILLALIPLKGNLIGIASLSMPGLPWEGVPAFAWEISKDLTKAVTFEIA